MGRDKEDVDAVVDAASGRLAIAWHPEITRHVELVWTAADGVKHTASASAKDWREHVVAPMKADPLHSAPLAFLGLPLSPGLAAALRGFVLGEAVAVEVHWHHGAEGVDWRGIVPGAQLTVAGLCERANVAQGSPAALALASGLSTLR